jgi:hypothetical protein
MASYCCLLPHKRQQQNLDDFPHLKRWFETIGARSRVERAYALPARINTTPVIPARCCSGRPQRAQPISIHKERKIDDEFQGC